VDLKTLQQRAARAAKKKADRVPLEKEVENPAKAYARRLGWWVRKFKSPGNRSAPDDVFGKNGRIFFIEFKRPGKKPTPEQLLEHEEMRRHGLTVYVCDNLEEAKQIIDAENEWV
jgi:hypothetical protein